MEIIAHSQQQYDKWQGWLNGEISKPAIVKLAASYINEIITIVGMFRIVHDTDENIFRSFASSIKPPKKSC